MDRELQRDMKGSDVERYLKKCHLPQTYRSWSDSKRRDARQMVLSSWFDPHHPNVLINNLANFLAAFFLWTEYYIKPENPGVYYFPDHNKKFNLLATVFGPPKESGEATKTIVTGTRRTGKTTPLITEAMPFLCINRPYTACLVSEFNQDRTKEEIKKIKQQVEDNDRIVADFGQVYPGSKDSETWNSEQLQFTRYPHCQILGHSLNSSQRGRGAVYGVVDDPETEETTYNRDWRRDFFRKLFDVYGQMFQFEGQHFCWIGTPIHAGSCLSLAMRGISEREETQDAALEDARFRDWNKVQFSVIEQTGPNDYVSHQPARISVEQFLKKLRIDPISARKEILCLPVTPGTRLYLFDAVRNGFMHCVNPVTKEEYFLDLVTGRTMPWKAFLETLDCYAAGDLADGQSADSDPGAAAFLGINAENTAFVLDAYQAICPAETLISMAYEIAESWRCIKIGWERVGMLCVVNRVAADLETKLRREGRDPPMSVEIDNMGVRKPLRMQRMILPINEGRIKFRYFDPFKTPDGVTHIPADYGRLVCYEEMLAQVREYTDEGIRGHDDLADALECAYRVAEPATVRAEATESQEIADVTVRDWEKVGVSLTRNDIPIQHWSPAMWEQVEKERIDAYEPLMEIPCSC